MTKELNFILEKLKRYPPGKLICAKNGNSIKWYRSDGHNSVYIPKKNRTLAEKLAAKKYLNYRKKYLEQEIYAIDAYLRHHKACDSDKLLQEESPYFSLLSTYFRTQPASVNAWLSEDYEQNPHFPEHLNQKTLSGIFVRSKSEAMIASLLYINKIPFRYECRLELDDVILYPDFTIMHPLTGELIYWEHFGLIDNEDYLENALSKMKRFTQNSIIPSVNLIVTYESQNAPLQMDYVNHIIQYYFL